MLRTVDIESLVGLFNIEAKRQLEKYCRRLVVHEADFTALIFGARAGVLKPYRYACHFSQRIATHLHPTDEELSAISRNGIGPLTGKARKAVSRMFQSLDERRCFAAHLFYVPSHSYWYLFYFDQGDLAESWNHWKHGPHIHLMSSHWPDLRLEDVWRQVRNGELNFAHKIYLRYLAEYDVDAVSSEFGADRSDRGSTSPPIPTVQQRAAPPRDSS